MKTKDSSVRTQLHWILTDFLLTRVDPYYRSLGGELIITSGSEVEARHGRTSLHYAIPGCAVDIRSWKVGEATAADQAEVILNLANEYAEENGLQAGDIEVILESTHIHMELQPKRREG